MTVYNTEMHRNA